MDIENDDAFSAARDKLSEASVVCFLGFGYHRTNLQRLRIPEIIEGKTIYGSMYGIGEGDKQRIMDLLPEGASLVGQNWRALEFLEQTAVFAKAS